VEVKMAFQHPTQRFTRAGQPSDLGPAVAFAAAVLIGFSALAAGMMAMPRDAILPALSVLFFLLAALMAFAGWGLGQTRSHRALSYWDVAGALTLFGICAGTLTEPDQLVRLIETQRSAD
jgi:putative Mn2+ efflux pump MntP